MWVPDYITICQAPILLLGHMPHTYAQMIDAIIDEIKHRDAFVV